MPLAISGPLGALTRSSSGYVVGGSQAYYAPFGAYRGAPPTTNPDLTDRAFTGQQENGALGLYYFNARYYVPGIGRFASADILVPEREDPQSFNRYACARNDPLKYIDSDGHCWGATSFIRGWNVDTPWGTIDGGTNCENIDTPLAISQHPDATAEEKAIAGAYLGGWFVAGASGAVGTGLLACSTIAPCAAAAESVLGIGTAACADGDCTNEVQTAGRAAQSVWNLHPLRRGVEIENMLGRSPQLAQNFPVIDRFQNGVATSIKSLDLGAKSYQNVVTLTRTVRGYVNTLANWRGVAYWGEVSIENSDIVAREVMLAVPPGASQAQINALLELQQWASSVGVTLNVIVVP